ncbi:putative ABC transporter ATP-binding protein [Actinomycetota bacterium]|nr:putative ABC transporter ATP-binding protein [Actinomycetota bacterium]
MMINKRLIELLRNSKKYIAGIVGSQWLSLLANIVMILSLANLLESLFAQDLAQGSEDLSATLAVFAVAAIIRAILAIINTKMGHLVSVEVKSTLRAQIYQKVLALGANYNQDVRTAEIVQVAGEGVDQLESYFGRYLPQLFYSVIAPLTLFGVLAFVNLPAALVLLIAVPLILVAIMAVSKMARRIFGKYWGIYTDLGANFLENLQGLTTLKIYQAEERKRQEMAAEAEDFRRVTMKVLSTQLGSITAMDLVAYGGAAIGIIVALFQFGQGAVSFAGCLAIILLSAEFFIPMRMLGSFFHIAMNGVAASDKIFALLDLPVSQRGQEFIPSNAAQASVSVQQLTFCYAEQPVLKDVSMELPQCGLTSVVGKSGCGKSTLAQAIMGSLSGYQGSIQLKAECAQGLTKAYEVSDLAEESIMRNVTLVSANSHIFKGTVRSNLLVACSGASDDELMDALAQVRLDEFLRQENGLDTQIAEGASNLSGGQKQRLALARALLHNTPLYIFDEATSNIDAQSESCIVAAIHQLAQTKAVLLISHRLANVVDSQQIYVLDNGRVVEQGQHSDLLLTKSYYASLYNTQTKLENFTPEDCCDSDDGTGDGTGAHSDGCNHSYDRQVMPCAS